MKKISLGTASIVFLGIIGLVACEAEPPSKDAVSQLAEPEAPAAGETLTDMVRESLADIYRDKDVYSRARRLGTLLPTLGPEVVPAVKQNLEDLTLDSRGTELELLLRYWATHQGEEASRWAKDESPPGYREVAVFAALSTWAEADPQAAVDVSWEWMEETPVLERIVPIAVIRGWYAKNDARELAQFIGGLSPGIPRQRTIAAYLLTVIQAQGAEAATRWAESLPDDDKSYKLAVFRRLVDALSRLDIEAGTRWCDAHCLGPYGDNMRSLIARTWVLRDGPSAMTWLSSAPEGYDKNLALRITFALWVRMEREAALAWMESQTTGEPEPWLEPLYPVYARSIAGDAPADAIQWAERIEDDSARESVLIRVARVWHHLDEAAAEAWLLESSLSEEAREKVRTAVQGRPEPNG